jgi:hypothetical protein
VGKTVIGTTDLNADAKLHVLGTNSELLRLSKTNSNYMTISLDGSGLATINGAGSTPGVVIATRQYTAIGEVTYVNSTGQYIYIASTSTDYGATVHSAISPTTAFLAPYYDMDNGGSNNCIIRNTGPQRLFRIRATISFVAGTAGHTFVFSICKGTGMGVSAYSGSRVPITAVDNTSTYTVHLQTIQLVANNELTHVRVSAITASGSISVKSVNLAMEGF